MRLAIKRHVMVMEKSEYPFDITYYNAHDRTPSTDMSEYDIDGSIPEELQNKKYDVILLHTTFLGRRWMGAYFYKFLKQFSWVRKYNSLKLAFPQDPYDHAEVLDEWMFSLGVDVLYSVLPKSSDKILYPVSSINMVMRRCLTGYHDSPEPSTPAFPTDHQRRKYDIVYRATDLPYWFGSHGQLKKKIGDLVLQKIIGKDFREDISSNPGDTITGSKWLGFLGGSRCVLGCESGSSVLDYRGEVQLRVKTMLNKDPVLSFEEVSSRMPKGWDDYEFFAISPRHLESIETMTCQLLIEGHYNGILKANKHYLPIKKDFSNLDEILEKSKDKNLTMGIAERAYEEILKPGRYSLAYFAKSITDEILARV